MGGAQQLPRNGISSLSSYILPSTLGSHNKPVLTDLWSDSGPGLRAEYHRGIQGHPALWLRSRIWQTTHASDSSTNEVIVHKLNSKYNSNMKWYKW